MLKKLFVLRLNDYWPELCKYTIPTIKLWCQVNGWQYNEITEGFSHQSASPTLSKIKIFGLGADADWNIMCDADLMLRPDFFDLTYHGDPSIVRSSYSFKASTRFPPSPYFIRDGRDIGISGGFVLSSKLTHDLWSDHGIALEQMSSHLADEWVISTNLAKYGLHYDGISPDPDMYIVHFGGTLGHTTCEEKAQAVLKASELWNIWRQIWPSLDNQKPEENLLKFCPLESVPK